MGPGSKRTEVDCKLYVSVFTSEQDIYVLEAIELSWKRVRSGAEFAKLDAWSASRWIPSVLLMAGPPRADVTDSSARGGAVRPYNEPSGSAVSVRSPEGAIPMTLRTFSARPARLSRSRSLRATARPWPTRRSAVARSASATATRSPTAASSRRIATKLLRIAMSVGCPLVHLIPDRTIGPTDLTGGQVITPLDSNGGPPWRVNRRRGSMPRNS